LHKFIGKKVTATQKSSARRCKEQFGKRFLTDCPKVNVFCALGCGKVYGTFFGKKRVNEIVYCDVCGLWLMPQLLQDKPNVVFARTVRRSTSTVR
jgi:hypothetical protein